MMTLNDIENVSFRRANFSGYRTEDVDEFIDRVKASYEELIRKNVEQKEKNEALTAENGQLAKKIEVLAAKIEEYRAEEEGIKQAIVSAQKLGDASLREARHKAEIIIKDANLKAERVVGDARAGVENEKKELERLRQSVADFRAKLLAIYKEHLTMIDAIPAEKPSEEEGQAPVESGEQTEPREDATREFVVESSEPAQEAPPSQEHDMRYDVLEFDNDISDPE